MNIKYLIISSLLMVSFLNYNVTAQENTQSELSKMMHSASILNSEILWDKSIEQAKNAYNDSNSSEDLLQLCYAYYGRVGTCLSKKDSDHGEKILELAIASAEKLSQDESYESLARSLLGGYYGMSIAFSPMSGMYLGPKSDDQIGKSLKLNPENAFAWLQKGSSQYNTPRIFGGSVTKSIDSFKKSIEYFNADESLHEWLKIEAMVWLGQAYHYQEEYQNAREVYQEILEIAPGFEWVEDVLMPKTLAQLN